MILSAEPSRSGLWSRAIGASTGLHALALASLFVSLSSAAEPVTEMPAIAVEMASPSSLPAPVHDVATPRQVEAPKQTPQEQPDVRKPPFDPPPALTVPAVKPEVALPPKKIAPPPTEKANPLPPAPRTTELAAPDLKPDVKVAAMTTGGASAGKATAADLWDAKVRSRVELTKRYPGAALQQGMQDDVGLLLTIDRSGRLLAARIRGSRGYSLLNDAALEAVRRAAPFPKPPKEIEGDPILYALTIRFAPKRR
jgi:protein TonB